MSNSNSNLDILAVIPARGGSKGIPRKNTRMLKDKPLVAHAVEKALDMDSIDKVVITTDDGEIARIGRSFKADEVINRPEELSTDEVPLAPVMTHVIETQEKQYDYVICLQPTTPLIQKRSIEKGIKKIESSSKNSLIFISNDTEHYWKGDDEEKKLLTGSRENRQLLDPIYQEVGVFISGYELIESGERIGSRPLFQEVSEKEGIDIDNYSDWIIAESELEKKKILYRSVGNEKTGLGHISRGITLAKRIFKNEIEFAIEKDHKLAEDLLEKNNLEYSTFEDEKEFEKLIDRKKPDIIVNDILDTKEDYIAKINKDHNRIVNIEDMGSGAQRANAVINALYERSKSIENEFYGSDYICLRDEFRYTQKKQEIGEVNQVMISYGGIDENNLTLETVKAIDQSYKNSSNAPYIDIVLGLGYKHKDNLESYLEKSKLDYSISQSIDWISEHMTNADLLFTSNGRTVYEAASLNVPMISISQNSREVKHLFSHYNKGIRNLGVAREVKKEDIESEFKKYIENKEKREKMMNALKEEDIIKGTETVKKIILGEYQK